MNNDLATQLTKIGLRATAERLDDFIARATTKRLAPRAMLERSPRPRWLIELLATISGS